VTGSAVDLEDPIKYHRLDVRQTLENVDSDADDDDDDQWA